MLLFVIFSGLKMYFALFSETPNRKSDFIEMEAYLFDLLFLTDDLYHK